MPVYQLRDLNQHIRETISDAYPDNLWIRAEIISCNVHGSSGHCYLELGDGNARMRAMVWKSTWKDVSSRFESESGKRLEAGMQVQVLVKAEFSVQYGMGLIIWDIDTAFTVGELAIRRTRALERLRQEGLLEKNKELHPGFPPFRIALITSPSAAGYEDFCKHLLENPFGYRYILKLFPAQMQGTESLSSIPEAFANLANEAGEFDLAAIIRGGGSRQDLQVFDEYVVAAALATCPVPVLSGIGHERDESLCDLVAYQNFKTPTAVADFILSKTGEAELAVDQLISKMASSLHWMVRNREQELDNMSRQLFFELNRKWRGIEKSVVESVGRIAIRAKERLHAMEVKLTETETLLKAGNPIRILELGFARISQNGKRIKSVKEISVSSPIKIVMKDGEITATELQ